jgi:hypothetical protein
MLAFSQLNDDWNAEPNAPSPRLTTASSTLVLTFFLNHQLHPRFSRHQRGSISFAQCSRWRLGSVNDEAWYRGQCRYSKLAPSWGEFYELVGNDPTPEVNDWYQLGPSTPADRHFLFYFRDEEFECMAADWSFRSD